MDGDLVFDSSDFHPAADDQGGPAVPLEWSKMRIVDCEVLEYGRAKGQGPVIATKYRLHIADGRHRFVKPFGGRVVFGEINKLPFNDSPNPTPTPRGTDANGNALVTNKELCDLCLEAMGTDTEGPATLNDSSSLKDLNWQGNHAPTELAAILERTQHAFTVQQGGNFKIVKIGDGTLEVSDSNDPIVQGLVIPSVERRSKVVVFSSFPTPIMDTVTVNTLDDQGWILVCPDKNGGWRPIADAVATFSNKSPADLVRGKFADVPENLRQLMKTYLYKCIMLSPKKFPRANIYRELHTNGELATNFEISGLIAVSNGDGTWSPSAAMVRCTPTSVVHPSGQNSIIIVKEVLGTVKTTTGDPDADFVELKSGELSGKVTLEATVDSWNGKGKKVALRGVPAALACVDRGTRAGDRESRGTAAVDDRRAQCGQSAAGEGRAGC